METMIIKTMNTHYPCAFLSSKGELTEWQHSEPHTLALVLKSNTNDRTSLLATFLYTMGTEELGK